MMIRIDNALKYRLLRVCIIETFATSQNVHCES